MTKPLSQISVLLSKIQDDMDKGFERIAAQMDQMQLNLQGTPSSPVQLSPQECQAIMNKSKDKQPLTGEPSSQHMAYMYPSPTQVPHYNLEPGLGVREQIDIHAHQIEIPVFNGVYPCGWIWRVERLFRLGQYTDEEKLRLVSMNLEVNVLSWFRHISFNNWKDFKSRLFVRFGNVTSPSCPAATSPKEDNEFGNYTRPASELDRESNELEVEKLQDKQTEEEVETVVMKEEEQPLECVVEESTRKEKSDEVFGDCDTNLVIENQNQGITEVLNPNFDDLHSEVAELYPKLTSVKTKSFAHQLFGTRFLSDKSGQELHKQSKFSKTWTFKFKHKVATDETVKEQAVSVDTEEEKKSKEEQDAKLCDSSKARDIEEIFSSEVKDAKEVQSVLGSEEEINEVVISEKQITKGTLDPDDYSSSFMEAVSVFQHASAYDFDAKMLKHLKPLSQNLLNLPVGQLEFLGPDLSPSVVVAIAERNVDPITMEAFNRFSVSLKVPVRSFKEHEKRRSFLLCSLSESEERIELKRTADEAKIDTEAVLKETMYSKQDLDLHQLVSQPNKDSDSGEYEVIKLVDICYGDPGNTGQNGLKFKVHWKGYSSNEDTWEPAKELSICQNAIRDFVTSGFKSKILPLPGGVGVICGGPPCQGISGNNRYRNVDSPLSDERNQQIIVFMDIVECLKPALLWMENVVDILRLDKGSLGRYALSRLVHMRYQASLGIMTAGCYGLSQFPTFELGDKLFLEGGSIVKPYIVYMRRNRQEKEKKIPDHVEPIREETLLPEFEETKDYELAEEDKKSEDDRQLPFIAT